MTAIVLLENTLRIEDNPAIYYAINSYKKHKNIIVLYIKDTTLQKNKLKSIYGTSPIPNNLNSDWFIEEALNNLNKSIKINVIEGTRKNILQKLIHKHKVTDIYINTAYEPLYITNYQNLITSLNDVNIHFYNANLLHNPKIEYNKQGEPYKVFSYFYKHLLPKINYQSPLIIDTKGVKFLQISPYVYTKIKEKSFLKDYWNPSEAHAKKIISNFILEKISTYHMHRDFPAMLGTSKISPYLNHGIISPNQILWQIYNTMPENDGITVFIKELLWREFAYYILYHNPSIINISHKNIYKNFTWEQNMQNFNQWQQGLTGYPIIDCGIKELVTTGTMHNRIRMLVASFLVKNLHYPWQMGARFFFEHLVDANLAINSFSWQWVAGCGFDAAPYFRVFNPVLQSKKFDQDGIYIKTFIKELSKQNNKQIHMPQKYHDKIENIVNFNESRRILLENI